MVHSVGNERTDLMLFDTKQFPMNRLQAIFVQMILTWMILDLTTVHFDDDCKSEKKNFIFAWRFEWQLEIE